MIIPRSIRRREWRRVARSGSAARATALVVCGGWIAAFFVGGGAQDWSIPAPWLFVGLPMVLLARSSLFGIYVNATTIKVVSWYWTYRFDRSTVQRVVVQNYNGFVVGWSGAVDVYSANVLMLGFESTAGRERFYPATAMRYSTAKAVAEELRSMLGLQALSQLGHGEVPRRLRRA